ncbi:MAG: hypothetical protein ACAI25_13955, partial [Planctomycetota bacterium]
MAGRSKRRPASGFEEASDSSVEEKPRAESRDDRRDDARSSQAFAPADLLPKFSGVAGRGEADKAVRAIVGELREACGACRYRRICGFAPVAFQIKRVHKGDDARHAHHRVLKAGVERLEKVPGWHKAILSVLAEREKDALLAGCLLATAWAKKPDKLKKLVEYTATRCDVEKLRAEQREEKPHVHSDDDDHDGDDDRPGIPKLGAIDPEKLRARMFRGQVLRLIAFGREPEQLKLIKDLLVLSSDDEGRLFQYEAVAALALLSGLQRPGDKWIAELEAKALAPFRATFASRDAGDGAIDIFFPYRRGKRRSYLYFRRDKQSGETVISVDKVRTDSLLYRSFRVFDSDEKKTFRIFKELLRHLNVRAGKMNADQVLAGFERIERGDLLLLGLYAPALARAVGHFLGVADYHLLVKFLYKLRAESGRRGGPRVPAHEKVAEARAEWDSLRGALGEEFVKEVFASLFKLNASYVKSAYTTDTYIKIGEVAYLLTALAGWNPKGLEIELKKGKKSLALIAYGLQPPDKWSAIRVRHLQAARDKVAGDADLERASEIGMRYMARSHRFETFGQLRDAADGGKLPANGVSEHDAHRDLEIDSTPPMRQGKEEELETSADNYSSKESDGNDDTGVDLHAKEAPPPRAKAPVKSQGLVGQRNVSF